MSREQRGYVFHNRKSWFVRYCDDVVQPDGTIKRKLVCKRLDVEYGGEYRTKKSVQTFVDDVLRPINAGLVTAQSTMLVSDFIDKIYLPEHVEKKLRAATRRQYRNTYEDHLKARLGKLTLRTFRTVHGEQMLAKIAEQDALSRSSLRHCKAFLSGAFKQAKRLGILDGLNPMQDTSIPQAPEPEETYAYSLAEIKSMLAVLPDTKEQPAWTVVKCAALTGLRLGEVKGLRWEDFDGHTLRVEQSVWNGIISEPKTRRSRAPIPVVRELAEALEAHRQRMGKLAAGFIFQGGTGKPLRLENLVNRVIKPAFAICAVCGKRKDEHKPEAHLFERDKSLPEWRGWHAFRRGLATNLHALGVDDKTIQAILRHSNIGITQNIYIKSVKESQVSAMDTLSEKLGTCNDLATPEKGRVN